MNWIKQIKRFYALQAVAPLSPHAVAIWHYLMLRGSSAFWRWPLTLRLSEIAGTVRISETAVKKARKELIDGGYLRHEKQPGNKAAKYTVIDLTIEGQGETK